MDLQQILILLGVLALGILIGHGVWSSRREKAQFEKSAQQFERQQVRSPHTHHFQQSEQPYPPQAHQGMSQQTSSEYPPQAPQAQRHYAPQSQYGYSQVQAEVSREVPHSVEPEMPYQTHLPLEDEVSSQAQVERRVENIKITLPNATVHSANVTSANTRQVESVASYEKAPTTAEQPRYAASSAVEMRAQVQTTQAEAAPQPEPEAPAVKVETKVQTVEEKPAVVEESLVATTKKPEFIMLYVVAPENRQFYGTHINEVLEDLGFIFGEYNIYHRHLDVNMVKSPVIFSVANMVQPGTFDPNNFDNFATIGLTLFMRLPSPGNDIVNFRMLCCAAETLAEKLNGFILNDKREIFTDEHRSEYLQLLRS